MTAVTIIVVVVVVAVDRFYIALFSALEQTHYAPDSTRVNSFL